MKILRLSDVEAPLCFDCGDCDFIVLAFFQVISYLL